MNTPQALKAVEVQNDKERLALGARVVCMESAGANDDNA